MSSDGGKEKGVNSDGAGEVWVVMVRERGV